MSKKERDNRRRNRTLERVSQALSGDLRQPYRGGENIFGKAAIAARLGEKSRAVVLLREAIRRGAFGQLDDAHEWLIVLRGYPAYEKLMKPQG